MQEALVLLKTGSSGDGIPVAVTSTVEECCESDLRSESAEALFANVWNCLNERPILPFIQSFRSP